MAFSTSSEPKLRSRSNHQAFTLLSGSSELTCTGPPPSLKESHFSISSLVNRASDCVACDCWMALQSSPSTSSSSSTHNSNSSAALTLLMRCGRCCRFRAWFQHAYRSTNMSMCSQLACSRQDPRRGPQVLVLGGRRWTLPLALALSQFSSDPASAQNRLESNHTFSLSGPVYLPVDQSTQPSFQLGCFCKQTQHVHQEPLQDPTWKPFGSTHASI